MPLKLEKRRFIILLVVGDIFPEVVLNSFFQTQVFYMTCFQSTFMTVPLQHTYSKGRPGYIIIKCENNMCSPGKQYKDNCQHFIDRGIKHHVCLKKAFCFLFHAVKLPLL